MTRDPPLPNVSPCGQGLLLKGGPAEDAALGQLCAPDASTWVATPAPSPQPP